MNASALIDRVERRWIPALLAVMLTCAGNGKGDERPSRARHELLHPVRLHERLRQGLADRELVRIDPALDDETWLRKVREADESLATDVLSDNMLRLAERHLGTPESTTFCAG